MGVIVLPVLGFSEQCSIGLSNLFEYPFVYGLFLLGSLHAWMWNDTHFTSPCILTWVFIESTQMGTWKFTIAKFPLWLKKCARYHPLDYLFEYNTVFNMPFYGGLCNISSCFCQVLIFCFLKLWILMSEYHLTQIGYR